MRVHALTEHSAEKRASWAANTSTFLVSQHAAPNAPSITHGPQLHANQMRARRLCGHVRRQSLLVRQSQYRRLLHFYTQA